MRATITMPRNTPDLVEVALAALVAVAIASAIYRDLVVGGLGRSNGRIVSFLESLNSAAGFRRQKRATNADETRRKSVALQRLEWLHITSDQLAPLKKLELFLIVFFNKFGTQGLGSLLVGATPVILKGPRHVASWFLAFAAVQLSPGDAVHGALQRHVVLTLVVKTGAALYKLRKFNFVVDACAGCSGLLTLFAMLVTIDGNNLCSRVTTWAWLRGRATTAEDVGRGAAAFVARCAPVALAACFVQCCGSEGELFATSPSVMYSTRLLVLGVFLYRNDVAGLCRQTLLSARAGPVGAADDEREKVD
mmetsp:Transcript_19359/g.59612  ORF Transcript_19359/g.59612 Transcript_19359/m.59612 type:complete len:307 (-) Transcript_19359:20-940(-)